MEPVILIAAIVVSYLIGSISFARIVTRILDPSVDIEEVTIPSRTSDEPYRMRSIGATTASIQFGGRVGCMIGLLDMFKVALPTVVFRLVYPDQPYFLLAATFGTVGHNWPVFYRFNGGSGISAIYGGFFVIDWLGAIVCAFAGLIFGLFIRRDLFLAYMSGVWFMIPGLWFRTKDPAHLIYAVLMNVFFMITLIPEIRSHIKRAREGKTVSLSTIDVIPMGKGMLRIMKFLGIDTDK